MLITCVMRNARAHKLQWSGPTVHSCTVTEVYYREFEGTLERLQLVMFLGTTSLDSPEKFQKSKLCLNLEWKPYTCRNSCLELLRKIHRQL